MRARLSSLLVALLAVLLVAAPAARAVDREEATRKALTALDVRGHDDPVIVFGLRSTIAAGSVISQSAPDGPAISGSEGSKNAADRARLRKIARAGVRVHRADVVLRSGAERTWMFFEDKGPSQAFEHPGRVVLVGARTGRVRIAGTRWVPLIDGEVPPFFRDAEGYEAKRFRVLTRSWSPQRARARMSQAASSEPRQRVADALAAERSCALRISDTLGDFYDFGRVDRTRARLGQFFEGLERLNAGFVSRRYTTDDGQTPVEAAQALIDDNGCRDLFLHVAGGAAKGGAVGTVVGLRPAEGGLIEWHLLTAADLEKLVEANKGVTFKFVFDAPYAARLTPKLTDEPNTVLLLAAGGPDGVSFTFLPEVLGPAAVPGNPQNPDRLLEFTNALINGLEGFVRSPDEVARHVAEAKGFSMMAWMMARAMGLSPAGVFAAPLELLKLPVSPLTPPTPLKPPTPAPPASPPTAVNHTPVPTTAAQPTAEDTARTITLTATDSDGDPLTFTVTDLPDHGTLTGTPPNLVYTPAKDFNGTDAFTYAVADNRGASAQQTVQIPVSSSNDPAVVTATSRALAQFVEDGAAPTIDGTLTITDADSAQLTGATATIAAGRQSDDVLDATVPAGVTKAYDPATGVLTLSGAASVADYQQMLRSVTFDTTSQTPGTSRTVEFRAADGEDDGAPAAREVLVEAVNDAPAVAVPATHNATEDTSTSLSPSVSDVDAAGGDVKVDLDVDHGTLTLSTVSGLTSSSGDGSGAVSLTGTVSEVNAAISGLNYTPATNFNGSDTLAAAIDDLGHDGSGGAKTDSDAVAITVSAVNDAPVNTVPGAQSSNEDTAKTLSGASAPSVADVDAGTDDVKATVSALHGQMTLNGVTGRSVSFTGTVAQVNAKLDGLIYTPDADYSGGDTVTVLTDDLTHNGSGGARTDTDTIAFTITGENDAPSITVPASITTDEDVAKTLTATVADPDAGNDDVKVDLTVARGKLTPSTVAGLTSHSGDGTGALSLTGSLSEVNAALTNLSYEPATNFNGADSIGAAVSDLGHSGTGGAKTDSDATSVTIAAVNDAPVNQLPSAPTLGEDASKTFSGTGKISIADVDAAGTDAFDVRVDVDHGTLAAASGSGATATGDGSDSIHLTGTFAQVNAALDGLTYTPAANYAGGDTLTIVSDDGGANGSGGAKSDTDNLTLTVDAVNDAPSITVTASITTDEDTAKTLTASIADVDAAASDVKVDLSAATGTLTLSPSSGLTSSSGSGTGTVSLTGALSEVNAALTDLTYAPAANRNGSDTIGVSASDLGHTGSGGAKTDSDSIGVTVAAVNDGPANTVPATATTGEDTPKSLTFSVADVDADPDTLTVKLTATNGTVTLASLTGLTGVSGNGTSSASFTGTRDDVNAALTSFTYTPSTNFNGAATVEIQTSDNGNTPGPAKSDTDSTAVTVSAINDAPVNTVAGAQTLAEDGSRTFSSTATTNPSVADVDAGASDDLQVSLSVGSGKLTLDATNLDFSAGDGTADGSMTFKGTKSEINGALDGLTYTPNPDFAGSDTLQIVTSDLGHTGAGGAKTDTDSIGLTVSGVDDAPVNTVPASASVTEDTAKSLTFSVADLDAGAQDVKATLTATHGKIKLAASPDVTSLTGDNSKAVEIVGSLVEVNTALTSFTYTPDADYAGADDSLKLVTSDLGNTGSGGPLTDTDSTTLSFGSVNDAPVITAPASASTPEDTQLTFSPVPTVGDVDAGSDDLRVTISVTQGTLTLAAVGGITSFTTGDGSDDRQIVFDAPTSAVNNALNGLKYAPDGDFSGADALNIAVSDQGNNGDDNATRGDSSVTDIVVSAVNDKPVVDLNGGGSGTGTNPTFLEVPTRDNRVTLAPGTTISDVDDASIESATVTLTNRPDGSSESLAAIGTDDITVDAYDPATGVLHLRGTAPKSEYEQALRTVSYGNTKAAPDPADRAVTFVVNDGTADSASATSTVEVVPLNTPPVVDLDTTNPSFDSAATFTEDAGAVNIAPSPDITDADLSDTHMESASITLTNRPDGSNESLSTDAAGTSGITVDAYDHTSGVLLLHGHGTVADYETLISRVKYANASETPNTANRSITVVVSDGQASSTSRTATVAVNSTNDAIKNTVPGAQSGTEDTGITFSGTNGNKISVSDADAGSGAVRVTVSAGHGSLSSAVPAGGSRSGSGTRTLELTGTVSAVNGALDGLGYAPDAHYNGGDTITVASDDQGNSGGAATTDSDTVAVSLAAVNDGPQNTVPGAQTVNEDTNLLFSSGNGNAITTDDADAGENPIKVTLGVERGVLTLGGTAGLTFTTGDGANDASMVFTGTVAAVKTALATVIYRGDANAFGADTLTMRTNDQGNSGGAAIEDTDSVAITVSAVNDEPTFTKGSDQANVANQDVAGNEITRTVTGWATSITKGAPNESGQTLSFTVTTSNDALFSTPPAINTSTGALTYTPSKTTSGTATVSVVLSDDGGTANGGDDTFTTQTFTITTVFPPPVARNDPAAANTADYAATGGVPIDIPSSIGVLANDDVYGATIASYGAATGTEQGTIATSTPTAGGGFVTVNANGSFRYEPSATPPVGGNDTFKYRIVNPGGASTATVTISVANQIVFVDDDAAAGGNGTQLRPYDELDDVPTTRSAGGVLFVASGTYTDDDGTEAVLLKSGEHLIGQGVTLASNLPFALKPRSISGQPAAGTAPSIGTSAATADGVVLNTGNTLKGVTLGASTRHALRGSGFGTLTVGSATAINTTGQAIELIVGTLAGGFDSITSTGGTRNVNLNGVGSTGTFAFGGGAVSGAGSDGFRISGENGSFSYAGSVSNSSGPLAVTASVRSKTGGTVTFSGDFNPAAAGRGVIVGSNSATTTVAFTGSQKRFSGSAPGITSLNNSGTTTFSGGGLDINVSATTGIDVLAGGTLNITGANNTVNAGTGTAINVNGGAGNVATTLNTTFASVSSNASSTNGILLDDATGTFSAGGGMLQNATQAAVAVTSGDAAITYGGTVANGQGNTADITDNTGGSVTLSGAISEAGDADATAENGGLVMTGNSGGTAVSLTGSSKAFNTGEDDAIVMDTSDNSTLTLPGGGLDIDTTSGNGLVATASGTLSITGTGNTIDATGLAAGKRALNISDTDLAAAGVTFQRISSAGGVNGVRLNDTGEAAGLTIAGTGATNSGGTISDTSQHGVVLANTKSFNADELSITGADWAGVDGTEVTNFTFTDGQIVNAGDTRTDGLHASLAFNDNTANNIDGTLTITGNLLKDHYGGGVDVFNHSGTISDATVSNNTIDSIANLDTSREDGISFNLFGDSASVASLVKAQIQNNAITDHPNGHGIVVMGSQPNPAPAPAPQVGTPGSATNRVLIDGNSIAGDATLGLGSAGVQVGVEGRGVGKYVVTNNGTSANPVRNVGTHGITGGNSGSTSVDYIFTGNHVQANNQEAGATGIRMANDKHTMVGLSVESSPITRARIESNVVRNTTGIGIRALQGASATGSMALIVNNNDVANGGAASAPIHVTNGGGTNDAAFDPTMCATFNGNTTAANAPSGGGNVASGIVVLKRGTTASTYDFGIVGLNPSPSTAANTEAHVAGLNPNVNLGAGFYAGKKVAVDVGGDTFTSCSMPAF